MLNWPRPDVDDFVRYMRNRRARVNYNREIMTEQSWVATHLQQLLEGRQGEGLCGWDGSFWIKTVRKVNSLAGAPLLMKCIKWGITGQAKLMLEGGNVNVPIVVDEKRHVSCGSGSESLCLCFDIVWFVLFGDLLFVELTIACRSPTPLAVILSSTGWGYSSPYKNPPCPAMIKCLLEMGANPRVGWAQDQESWMCRTRNGTMFPVNKACELYLQRFEHCRSRNYTEQWLGERDTLSSILVMLLVHGACLTDDYVAKLERAGLRVCLPNTHWLRRFRVEVTVSPESEKAVLLLVWASKQLGFVNRDCLSIIIGLLVEYRAQQIKIEDPPSKTQAFSEKKLTVVDGNNGYCAIN